MCLSLLKVVASQLRGFSRKPADNPTPENEEKHNWKRLRGYFRLYTLYCAAPMQGIAKKMPSEIDMTLASDLHYFEMLYEYYQNSEDKPNFGKANVAAGLLTFGRLEMVDIILENLPYDEYVTGSGKCFLFPMNVMAVYLGIPDSICSTSRGRMDRQALLAWLATHRSRLVWNAEQERYDLLNEN